ncbi:hypothetical protein [Streptomyces sp. NBC_00140]|uniref:hypothetical protein n=1 Tax=Streptomyces sp. NBC_00140 TaxID=2975664 RepID=UPI0022500A44|nr:hypothetical protein [Streptomyces sp. NBC_00140]MCX5328097.1 hypothetical protein [Streptomyces sp. NBC_00140]
MSREGQLNRRRWKISYTYRCTCDPQCYWTKIPGRHAGGSGTFLNNGEEALGAEAAAAIVADQYRHVDIADIRMWQESAEERDARLALHRSQEADGKRGVHWAMGGAN